MFKYCFIMFFYQEVEETQFNRDLQPKLQQSGYEGILGVDTSVSLHSGQAIFWKGNSFSLLQKQTSLFHELAKNYIQVCLQ